MGTQVKIRNALQAVLVPWATSKSVKVAWENRAFEPAASYVRARLFPSPTQDPSIGARHQRYLGIFRISFCANLTEAAYSNKGAEVIESMAEEIVALYKRGNKLVKDDVVVSIEYTPSQSSITYDGCYAIVDVEVIYRSDIITTT